jgi:hypothetical protein
MQSMHKITDISDAYSSKYLLIALVPSEGRALTLHPASHTQHLTHNIFA